MTVTPNLNLIVPSDTTDSDVIPDLASNFSIVDVEFKKIQDRIGIVENYESKPPVMEEFIANEGQTVFTLLKYTYRVGIGEISVEIDGVPQDADSFTETDVSTITLVEGLPAGAEVKVIIRNTSLSLADKIASIDEKLEKFPYVIATDLPKGYAIPKGDGLTNDTSALQGAINYAVSCGKNRLRIPKGTYLINGVRDREDITKMGNLIIPSNFELWLDEQAVLKVIANDSPLYAILNANNTENVYIHGGKLVGDRNEHNYTPASNPYPTHEWGHGITAQNVKNMVIEDMEIVDFTGDGIYIAGIYPVDGIKTERVFINRVKVDNVRRNGIALGHGRNMRIKDCTLTNINGANPQSGIDIEGESAVNGDANGVVDGVIIEGCYFSGSAVSGISLVNCKNIHIHDNIFREQSLGIVPYHDAYLISVHDNAFENATYRYAIQIATNQMKISNNQFTKARLGLYPYPGTTSLYHVLVNDNMMNDSLIYQDVNITFENVVIKGNDFYAIQNGYSAVESPDGITSNGLELTDNRIRVTANHGIKLQGSRIKILNNFIEYASKNGIHLNGLCHYALIKGNVIKDWSDGQSSSAIYFPNGGNRIVVENNAMEVSSNGSINPLAGVNIFTGGTDAIVKNNTITIETRTLTNGLYLNGSNIISVNNVIVGTCTTPKSGTGIVASPTTY